MNNNVWKAAMTNIIDKIETAHYNELEIDRRYNDMCSIICKEMDKYLQIKCCSKTQRRNFKISKPYWNNELAQLWKVRVEKENLFLKCTDSSDAKRYYISLEESAKSGDFWKKIPGNSKKSKTVPMKIKNPDGSTSYNIYKWKHDLSVMYNYDAEAGDVSQELFNQKTMKVTEIIQNGYECNTFLKSGLSYDELEKVIS